MSRKLIIEGNSVYEIDEECMLRKRLDQDAEKEKERSVREGAEKMKSDREDRTR